MHSFSRIRKSSALLGLVCLPVALLNVSAMERYFTYTYEPETMPKGALEYEQWVTLRAGRNQAVGQENFNLWEFREELEYGVTDRYSLSLYLNHSFSSYRDPVTDTHVSDSTFDGVSLENRYMVLNPAEHAVGLTLYVEPRYSGDQAELEERIILGQRHGDWKWALNFTHATEWSDDLREVEGEVEVSLGITRHLGHHWSIGIEARDHNELPNYETWQNTAVYFGPVVTYRQEKWWASLAVMPQVYGTSFDGNPSKSDHFELEGHEHLNVRLLVGFSF